MTYELKQARTDASKVLLVSGLWPYHEVDEKKSVGRLNIFHNDELTTGITGLIGVDSIYDLAIRREGGTQRLFTPTTSVEPTLVSVALRSLIGDEASVTEVELASVVGGIPASDTSLRAAAKDAVCLLSTSYITNFADLRRVVDNLRRLHVGYLVVGGYLATRNAESMLECGADAAIVGDAEHSIAPLLAALRGGADFGRVPNLRYRDENGEQVYTSDHLVPLDEIPVTIPSGDLTGMSVPYESMRGCPYKCAFCSYPLVSTKWRFKSAEKLIEDWTTIERRGAKDIVALDSTFTIPPKRLTDFLNLYAESRMTIPWGAYSRVTPLRNEETVIRLKRANNRWLSIGFESGSQRMLDLMKKGTRLKDAYPALANLRKHRISAWSNFIIGYPGETPQTVAETVAFMSDHLFGFYGIYVFNIRDRAMPVLSDPQAGVHWDDVGSDWSHATMTSGEASEIRWRSYVRVAEQNAEAINIDVFRGSNVEKDYGAWSSAFPVLKLLERWSLRQVDPGMAGLGARDDLAAIESELRRRLVPASGDAIQ
ncbi:B12-binding domain-containing radical SAM protein [Actinoplanes subtropicus]|uniref:B12-binding domain-containing radical SAM protein n=1 Tax=Actinoplanes subtropicus TaxID=543632 RepID=UPI000690B0F0|nr:B12-binding domain-containing radical SAM protein [Actinoplanes subtropicus]